MLELLEAQIALLAAQAAVLVRPMGRLVQAATDSAAAALSTGERPPLPRKAWRLAAAVRRASRYGVFRPKCLVRAMALDGLLKRHGMAGGRVCVGVQRRDGAFAAHAWVELGGYVLGEPTREHLDFQPLGDVRLVDALRR